MQNRNFIKIFAILFGIVSLYQLSFTWVAAGVEDDAVVYASEYPVEQQQAKKQSYLDSINSEPVYDIFLTEYTYADCKSRELNLGLDLKGGMNVTLEVMVVDVIKALSAYSNDSIFNLAISNALNAQKNSQDDFVTLFGAEYEKLSPNNGLAVLFTSQLRDKVKINATNNEVISILSSEVEDAISRSFNILRSRIDRFGVTQPNIQRLENSGRILVELPGIKDPERARKLLQSTAQLEFWETYEYNELFEAFELANAYLRDIETLFKDNLDSTDISSELSKDVSIQEDEKSEELALLDDILDDDSLLVDSVNQDLSFEEFASENPLYAVLYPNVDQQTGQLREGPVVGICAVKDTPQVNQYLNDNAVNKFFPLDVVFSYSVKPIDIDGKFVNLVALKSDRGGNASMEGDVVTDANEAFGQFSSTAEVSMSMNSEGAKQWKRLTADNIGKSVAIVLDGYVYSYPTVQAEIAGGRSSITGDFTLEEAKDLANILKSGKLPAPARIIEEAIVGPSLGKEAISSGMYSFIFALIFVLIYITFYYSRAGLAANVALLVNIFFIFGVLSSLGAVLTLPGIAGIILTIGMSIDANVLIYERIREEIKNGKGLKLAIADGYNSAYSSIIDANVTTLLTGIILYVFGTGPIKGFATTLVIGILTSLFAAIFITRLIISARLIKGKTIAFATKITDGAFKNINIDFIAKRKRFYVFSSILILLGLGSLFTKGLNYGVDFVGGRTYVVRFSENVDNESLRSALSNVFIDEDGLRYSPQVKTFGNENQVKITTSFMIENNEIITDEIVESKLSEGLATTGFKYEIMSSQKVGPTIADDIKDAAVWSVFFSLIVIFLYILIRFRKWQFSLGAVCAVFHDVLFVLSIFSIFYGVLPFSLEIDQAFIAAILTIIGYSLNDTVVVFDRVREYLYNNKRKEVHDIINGALNSTLSRTINTSLTTFFVLLVIFIFGGEVIRGFMFALMVGVLVGTYSSLFIASPIMLDTIKKNKIS
ncbi:MAG: protein translocase subunit SecDF [Flavobacteriales bacterium]|nr:protein translocase subunit SecDF [Flavobacteriales bacterium]